MVKKMYLNPKNDTVVICLPQEWVGKPLICTLRMLDDQEMVSEVSESSIQYQNSKFARAGRNRRLRKTGTQSE